MCGSIVDNGTATLLGNISRADDIESAISQVDCGSARESSRLCCIEDFDLDAHSFRRSCILGR